MSPAMPERVRRDPGIADLKAPREAAVCSGPGTPVYGKARLVEWRETEGSETDSPPRCLPPISVELEALLWGIKMDT